MKSGLFLVHLLMASYFFECCGASACEIKCPYKHKDQTTESCLTDKSFCLRSTDDGICLDKNQAYCYQVQCQILVANVDYVD